RARACASALGAKAIRPTSAAKIDSVARSVRTNRMAAIVVGELTRLLEGRPTGPNEQRAGDGLRQPPVPAAGNAHDRGHEQRADDCRVEDDAGGQADPELLDVRSRAGREDEEGEHEHERG